MGHCGAEHPQRAMEFRRPPRHVPRAHQSQRPAVIFLHSESQVAGSTSPSSSPPAPMLPPPPVQEQSSVSLNPSAPTTAPHSPDWSPSPLPSSHSAGTRLRQIHPPTTLHIGRESDLQATQGQSFTSDENPIFRPPRAKASHRTRIRSSGHPGPKLHIGRESDLQATQGRSFTSDENPIFRPPRAKASHRMRIRSSGHPGPKLHIGRESDLQAT